MTGPTTNRRRFLALASAGTGVSVAGCSDLTGDDPAAAGSGDGRRATLAVQPDQQAIQEAGTRINEQVQNGTLERGEAQQEMMRVQQEAVGEAVASVESELEDSSVSIEDSQEQQGALLVSGPATGLIDLLDHESVGALLDAGTFEEMQQQGGVPAGG